MKQTDSRISQKLYGLVRKGYYEYKRIAANAPKHSRSYWKNEIALDRRADAFELDFAGQPEIYEEFRFAAAKYRRNFPGESINDCYYKLPLREKTILIVGLGKNVRGSMQYILNELNSSPDFEGYDIHVRTSDETDALVQEFIRQNNWTRTSTVPNGKKYRALMESAKYLITEVFFPEAWVKKPGQIYINIWHGTPLKKLGLAKNFRNTHRNGTTQKNFIDADYLTYPNLYTRDKMLDSYRVSQLMDGKALMLGYPRTGGMLAASQSDLTAVRQKLAPNGEKFYAFMPTFRDHLEVEEVVEQSAELLDYLDGTLRDDQILYVNLHHKVSDSIDYSKYRRVRKFPPDIDSYQLLAASEALISDYSSVFFDYLVLRKQIVLYIPDYEEYVEQRGMYMNLMDLPFDMARTKEDVLSALMRGKQYDDEEAFQTFCPYDTVDNAKKLCSLISGKDEDLRPETIVHDSRRRIMIYSDAMQDGKSTSLLHEFTSLYNRKDSEVYLGCDMELVDSNKDSAYPMLFENTVIGSEAAPHLSAIGKVTKELYLEKRFTFEQMIACLRYDYNLMLQRMYGRARFDLMVIYDTVNPERILSHTTSAAPKLLFLQKAMLEKAVSDDFLRDSLRFAAKYSRAVCVLSDDDKADAESLLGESWKDQVQVVSSGEEINEVMMMQLSKKI